MRGDIASLRIELPRDVVERIASGQLHYHRDAETVMDLLKPEALKWLEPCGYCQDTGWYFNDKSWYPEYQGQQPNSFNYGYSQCTRCGPVDHEEPEGYGWVERKAATLA